MGERCCTTDIMKKLAALAVTARKKQKLIQQNYSRAIHIKPEATFSAHENSINSAKFPK